MWADKFYTQTLLLKAFYLLFWYQVFTWVSLRFSRCAMSNRSCTLRYFCFSKDSSRDWSCLSLKIVRALRDLRLSGLSDRFGPTKKWSMGLAQKKTRSTVRLTTSSSIRIPNVSAVQFWFGVTFEDVWDKKTAGDAQRLVYIHVRHKMFVRSFPVLSERDETSLA